MLIPINLTLVNNYSADVIVINADIRTSDASKPRANVLAVKDGRFIAVGSQSYVESLLDKDTKIIDANGRTIIPGLIDAHTHILAGTDLQRGVDLFELDTKEAWLNAIQKSVKKVPEGQWLVGGRWNVQLLPKQEMPTLAELDAITPNISVALVDTDYHSLWVNSKAMEMLNINDKTQAPSGGIIVRDAAGKLTGVYKETAQTLIQGNPIYTSAQPPRTQGLRDVINHFNSLGVTSVHDMINHDFSAYKSLLQEGKFPMRIWFGFMVPTDEKLSNSQTFKKYGKQKDELNNLSFKKEAKWKMVLNFVLDI